LGIEASASLTKHSNERVEAHWAAKQKSNGSGPLKNVPPLGVD
jgi:hypothetical protein